MRQQFRMSEAQLAKLRNTLKQFEGTKNYHNYTSGKSPHDASAKRFIMWFRVEEPIIRNNLEWLRLRVKGQSFMLHQIRKMVGMAVAVMRTEADEEKAVPLSFMVPKRNVPRVPGTGLFLRQINFEAYNNRIKQFNTPADPLDWSQHQVRAGHGSRGAKAAARR